jgi:cell division protein FtsQ
MSTEKLRQVVVPRRRTTVNRAKDTRLSWDLWRENRSLLLSILSGAAVLFLLVWVYQITIASPVFQLRTIEVSGNNRISSHEIEQMVRQNLTGSLMAMDLGKLHSELAGLTWVRKAQITRVMPDTLRLDVEERRPLMLARFDGEQPLWMDEDLVVLGEYNGELDSDLPPLVTGLSKEADEASQATNRERMETYKRLMWTLDNGAVKYSSRVEEIDLKNLQDVRLQLSPGQVTIDLGDRDFRARLARAVDILDALRRRDSAVLRSYKFLDNQILQEPEKIRFISVVHPTQVAIRSAGGVTSKTEKAQ